MPTYRVEIASTSRAGCKNKECQDNKVKIQKGELRLGSWVETENYQSWAWKHWGCVTPRQIVGLQEVVEDDRFDDLDGYDELDEENQRKIREAVAQGHVADEDWKGDIEVNRPGKIGFRVRASKKKKDAEEARGKEQDHDEKPKSAKRGRGKKAAKEAKEEEEEAAEPVSKKGKTTKRKSAAVSDAPEGDNEESQPTAKKQRKKKATAEADVQGEYKPAKTTKTRAGRGRKKSE